MTDASPAAPLHPLLDPAARPIIAHRGGSGLAPENTLAAFTNAARLGADAIELDVRGSAEGVPVVIHDATLDRTTDGSGPVARLTAAELAGADAGARFSPDGGRSFPFRGAAVRIPTLAEVLEALPTMPLLVELKTAAVQWAVRRLVEERGAVERCVFAAAELAALEAFRTPPFRSAAAGMEIARFYRDSLMGRLPVTVPFQCLSVPLRHRGLPVATRRFIAAAGRLGCPVHVWTVNRPATAIRLWRRNASGVVTDRPDLMLAAR